MRNIGAAKQLSHTIFQKDYACTQSTVCCNIWTPFLNKVSTTIDVNVPFLCVFAICVCNDQSLHSGKPAKHAHLYVGVLQAVKSFTKMGISNLCFGRHGNVNTHFLKNVPHHRKRQQHSCLCQLESFLKNCTTSKKSSMTSHQT